MNCEYPQSTGETDEKKALKSLQKKLKEVHADQIGARQFIRPQLERVRRGRFHHLPERAKEGNATVNGGSSL